MRDRSDDPNIVKVKKLFAEKQLSRRQFIGYSTALGLSAAAAYSFISDATGDKLIPAAQAAGLPKGGTLRLSMLVSDIKSPHAFITLWDGVLAMQTIEFLTKVTPDGALQPHLLESWSASEDLKTWNFNVRKGVKWHKGRDFTADDVIWNIKHALDPATGSGVVGMMRSYMMDDEGTHLWDANAIEKVDSHSFRMNLKTPTFAVPINFYFYTLLMVDPEEKGFFGAGGNGTGAFELVQHDVARKAVLKARTDYWGTGPYLDTIEFIDHGGDPSAEIAALASKQIDGLAEASIQQFDVLQAMPNLQLYRAQSGYTTTAGMKVTRKPFDDVRVRTALKKAIDPMKVVGVVTHDLGLPGEHTHVFPGYKEYYKLPPFEQDVDGAKKLLSEAGYPDGFETDLVVPQTPWICPLTAQALVEQWKDIGVKVALKVIPEAQFWDSGWPNASFSMPWWVHRSIPTMVLEVAYRSNVPWNVFEWSNRDFDQALTEAVGTLDVDKRREVMGRIEKIIQEDGPVVQPVWIPVFTFHDKRVKGFEMQPAKYIFGNELAIESPA